MNLIIKSAKNTSPIAFTGSPNAYAIKEVTIEAIILQDMALIKLRLLLSTNIFFLLSTPLLYLPLFQHLIYSYQW